MCMTSLLSGEYPARQRPPDGIQRGLGTSPLERGSLAGGRGFSPLNRAPARPRETSLVASTVDNYKAGKSFRVQIRLDLGRAPGANRIQDHLQRDKAAARDHEPLLLPGK